MNNRSRRTALAGLFIPVIALVGCSRAEPIPEPWVAGPDSPVPRSEAATEAVDGALYVFGGFVDSLLNVTTRVDRYDPVADTWSRRADMPQAVTHLAPALDGTTLWFAGGFEGQHPGRAVAAVWRYDTETDTWATGPSLPEPRAGGGLVRVGRRLHYIGGFDATRDSTKAEHWSLSIDDPQGWQTEAPLPTRRGHLGAAVVGGMIYIFGGQFRHDTFPVDMAEVERYDPSTGTWTDLAPMPTARSHFEPGAFVHQNRIYAFGGRDNQTERWALSDGVYYDIATDTWHSAGSLPFPILAPVVRPLGDRLYAMTGSLRDWNRPYADGFTRPLAGLTSGSVTGSGVGGTLHEAPAQDPRHDEVLATLQGLFDALGNQDAEALAAVLHPDVRMHSIEKSADGTVAMTPSDLAGLAERITTSPVPLIERMWDPVVQVEGPIANVWTPYDFYRGEELSHCGIDAVTMMNTGSGWTIIDLSWTRLQPPECPLHPDGPPTL